jgi:phage portal protein BeeE
MSIFQRIWGKKSRDKPKNYLSTAFTFLFGPTSSGNVVTERTAMQTTAVYACVRVLSEAIAGLPLNLYRYTPDGGKEKAINHPLYNLLHDAPNPEMTSFIFRETLMSHCCYGAMPMHRSSGTAPGSRLHSTRCCPARWMSAGPRTVSLSIPTPRTRTSSVQDNRCQQIVLSQDEVLHVPGLGFDGLIGYSPIAMAKNAIGMSLAAEQYGALFLCQRCYTGWHLRASGHREGSGQAAGKLACPIFRHEPA